jgi:hypothetical protein
MKLKGYLAKGKEAPPKDPTSEETNWMLVDRLVVSTGRMWIGDPGFSRAECRDYDGGTLKLSNGTYLVEAKAQEFDGPRLVTRMRAYFDGNVGKRLNVNGGPRPSGSKGFGRRVNRNVQQ